MDLGLKGRKAVVSAASRGLGLAAARSLAREGVSLTMNARSPEALEKAADEIRSEFGVDVKTVAADFNTTEGREEILSVAGDVDILVAAEMREAGRATMRGFVTPDRTTLIASSHRALAIM